MIVDLVRKAREIGVKCTARDELRGEAPKFDPTILPFSWMWLWFLAKKTGLARLAPIAARAPSSPSLKIIKSSEPNTS